MNDLQYARLLAEILRLQRWAGGTDSVSAARIFGLMHGFETVLRQEVRVSGITEETEEKVERLLEEVQSGRQATEGIKDRLRQEGIDETQANCVMQLCVLQGRFSKEVVKKAFFGLRLRTPESDWLGALHYMELEDSARIPTEDAPSRAVFSPCVPRVGEIVEPEKGSMMRVVAVRYVATLQGEKENTPQTVLIPHVVLESIGDGEEQDTPLRPADAS